MNAEPKDRDRSWWAPRLRFARKMGIGGAVLLVLLVLAGIPLVWYLGEAFWVVLFETPSIGSYDPYLPVLEASVIAALTIALGLIHAEEILLEMEDEL